MAHAVRQEARADKRSEEHEERMQEMASDGREVMIPEWVGGSIQELQWAVEKQDEVIKEQVQVVADKLAEQKARIIGIRWNKLEEHRKQCVFEKVPCPLGCGQSMLRKDVEAHERDATAMVQHNRLAMAKVAKLEARVDEQERDIRVLKDKVEEQGVTIADHEDRAAELENRVDELHDDVFNQLDLIDDQTAATEGLSGRIDELKWEVDHVANGEVIVLKIMHAQLTGDEHFYSEVSTVARRAFRLLVVSEPRHYAVYLVMEEEGPLLYKVKCTIELVHHDNDDKSAAVQSFVHTYGAGRENDRGYKKFISKRKLADPRPSPWVKGGVVTFKCIFEIKG